MAAANPIFGDYDRHQPAAKNIGLPDSLLSRFDLLFIVLDNKNPRSDWLIASWVIQNHWYDNKGENLSVLRSNFEDFVLEPILQE